MSGNGDRPELPEGWEWSTMGEVARVVGGSTPKSKEPSYWGGEISWLGVADLTEHEDMHISEGRRSITKAGYESCATQMVPAGTVLFSSRAPIGYVAIAAKELCTSQGFKSFVPSARVTSEYLYWWLKYAAPIAESMASGTTFKELSGKRAAAIPVPLPSIEAQREIVRRLASVFELVTAGEAELDAAQAKARAVAAAVIERAIWRTPRSDRELARFGEIVRRERREAFEEAVLQGTRRGKYALPVEVEEVPPCPDGAILRSVDQVASLVTDGDHNPPKRHPDGVPHLTARNIRHFGLDLAHTTFITAEDFERVAKRYRPQANDVIVTCVGTIGRVATVPPDFEFSPDRNLAAIRPLPSIGPKYLMYALASPSMQARMAQASGSTAQPHLYLGDLRKLPVPVRAPQEQARVVSQIDVALSGFENVVASLASRRAAAHQLRRAVLRDALHGQLSPGNLV